MINNLIDNVYVMIGSVLLLNTFFYFYLNHSIKKMNERNKERKENNDS